MARHHDRERIFAQGLPDGARRAGCSEPRGHASLSQTIRADDYAGTRVRVSAWVKSRSLERGGRFSVTTFAADAGPLSPGMTRATCDLEGAREWRKCEGVLDVPTIADTIEILKETEPEAYWQTPHYEGWEGVLVRYDAADGERVKDTINRARAFVAAKPKPRPRKKK